MKDGSSALQRADLTKNRVMFEPHWLGWRMVTANHLLAFLTFVHVMTLTGGAASGMEKSGVFKMPPGDS